MLTKWKRCVLFAKNKKRITKKYTQIGRENEQRGDGTETSRNCAKESTSYNRHQIKHLSTKNKWSITKYTLLDR